jgi:transcriptional regulator with XRE-family HTH domain
MDARQVGPVLALLRSQAGVPVEQVAKHVGMKPSQLKAVETSIRLPRLTILLRILEAIEVRPAQFFALLEILDASGIAVQRDLVPASLVIAGFTLPPRLADSLLAMASGLGRLYVYALSLGELRRGQRAGTPPRDQRPPGRVLGLLRAARGLTTREAAAATGVSYGSLSILERQPGPVSAARHAVLARDLGYKEGAVERAWVCLELLDDLVQRRP